MRKTLCLSSLLAIALAAQTGSGLVMVTPETATWEHEKNDPPGSESILLREDATTGGLDLLVRYPSGHKLAPHWHSANERMVVVEGTMQVEVDGIEKRLGPGSYAFMPAQKAQKEACVSATRCSFYASWDRKLDFHR